MKKALIFVATFLVVMNSSRMSVSALCTSPHPGPTPPCPVHNYSSTCGTPTYSYVDITTTQHTYRKTTVKFCICLAHKVEYSDTISGHSYSSSDMGHSGTTHLFKLVCNCGYSKTSTYPCNGNPHVFPMTLPIQLQTE